MELIAPYCLPILSNQELFYGYWPKTGYPHARFLLLAWGFFTIGMTCRKMTCTRTDFSFSLNSHIHQAKLVSPPNMKPMKTETPWKKFRLEKVLEPAEKKKRSPGRKQQSFTQRRLMAAKSRFGELAHKHRFLIIETGKPDIELKSPPKNRGIAEITLYYEDCVARLETAIAALQRSKETTSSNSSYTN
ncbi:hypothetical protein BIZ37_08750 [Photobacterium sp. BZF1]|uniref:hypothetical protein n=1 Tax=Photobacterium sp. BZF1 TaxID=1904457 RepID=UPI001653A094|nr:hypothetical protein [Photobacterium sp. BZF1]MBC7002643.1 hypothetical protein [Photobacterium sp. BZF1]